ncbi:MAG: PD-(D/E)XK nuclease family protein [Granulosicoccus sp.]|nr:PD-(D/E)XK nuclease family protein [Granulosicoccus sp.]
MIESVNSGELKVTSWNEQIANGALLLTVNQRLARHHLSAYQLWQVERGHTVWDSPGIMPLRAWLMNLHADALALELITSSLIPEILSKRIWRQVVEQHSSSSLLDVQAAAQLARQAWQLSCSWQCENDENQYLSVDQFTWQRWLTHYRQWLQQESLIDDAQLPDALSKHMPELQSHARLPRQIILDGFIQLPPQLASMFNSIEACDVEVVHVGYKANAVVSTLQCDDDDHELSTIAAQMRCELEQDNSQSLGLVILDLQQRRDAVLRAFDRAFFPGQSPDVILSQGRPYDLSLGIPLSEQRSIDAALSLLVLCCTPIAGTRLSSILLSPYLVAADEEAAERRRLDRKLRELRVNSLSLRSLLQHLGNNSRLHQAITQLLRSQRLDKATLSEWAARFSEWLGMLGWPGKGIDSEEQQAVMAWHECLDDMQILDRGESIDLQKAMQELRLLCAERVFQPEVSAAPIQIVGRLESHGLAFDRLWVAGLDDESWPPAGSANPFLQHMQQKASGIPEASAGARLQFAEQEFKRWASQAPQLIVSYASSRDGNQLSAAPLPTITAGEENRDLISQCSIPVSERGFSISDLMREIQSASSLETLVDDHGPALAAGTELPGGARLFENQALCPFRAFAFHRLAIRALEEPGLGLDARQHGTVLHAALEQFWKETRSHKELIQLSEDALQERIERVVDMALADTDIETALRKLELRRLCELMYQWIEFHEKPRADFRVLKLEHQLTVEHGGVVMKVILDRIDTVGDSQIVVDYKSGISNQISAWADNRIRNPQLPLYVLTDDAIDGAAFAQIASNRCKFLGIAIEKDLLPGVSTTVRASASMEGSEPPSDWPQWRLHWKDALDGIASEVRQGLASVSPIKGACTHCELKALCRIDEQSAETDEPVADSVDNSP